MPKKSAGLLLVRPGDLELEVLLVHPGGPFWARKDEGAWSIPKGEFDDDEDPLDAARREFAEETGGTVRGTFIELEPVRQKSGKMVYAWAVHCDFDPSTLTSQPFSMEWPPRSGKQQSFPEVDRAGWFGLKTARLKILSAQVSFIDQIEQLKS